MDSSSASRDSRESSSDGDAACPPAKVIRRLWHDDWKDTYPWARYDTATGCMYRQVCTDHKDNSLCFPGTNRLKKAVLGDHEKSKKHKEATFDNRIRCHKVCGIRLHEMTKAWVTFSA